MNQGKLEVVKQEMARVSSNILGISELKWTGMDEFNSDNHYICYCGQESFRRNGVALIVNKRVLNAVLRWNRKNDRMISIRFQGKPFNITVFQVYVPISNLILGYFEFLWLWCSLIQHVWDRRYFFYYLSSELYFFFSINATLYALRKI